MIIGLVQYVAYWLNNIPKIGQDYSPRDLVVGEQQLDYKSVCRIPFGAYAQVHDDAAVTNTMETRTTGALNMGPTGNTQGAHRFLSLKTGEIIVRRNWTEMPMPAEAIDQMMELVEKDLNWDEINNEDKDNKDKTIQQAEEIETFREKEKELEQEEITHEINIEHEEEEEEYGKKDHEDNLRPNRKGDDSHKFTMLSVTSGLKRWGDRARDAILDELKLFITEEVFEQVTKLTQQQIESALRIHCFITEKRDGRVKARAVADGRTQTRYSEEQTYSPTVSLESIMLCSLIDAFEGRDVTTVDIKGAFLKAKVPEDLELIVKMDGEMANLLCRLDPKFNTGKEGVLYLKCLKALYGHIEAARLFYNELDNTLEKKMGFKKNSLIHVYTTKSVKKGRSPQSKPMLMTSKYPPRRENN